MVTERQHYLAFMLRLWRVGEDGMAWRASLENAHTGARQGFASLDALLAFLEEQTGRSSHIVAGDSCLGSGESR